MKAIGLFSLMNFLMISAHSLWAQRDSSWQQKPDFKLEGYLDVFYVYDFNRPEGKSRQPFFYNHNRHNEFNLNLGYIKFGVQHQKYRANLAFHAGTYVADNYNAEPGVLKNILEANVGFSLHKKDKLWLDAGIMPSHIGFESAFSHDNLTMTRSILAENSPYFMTGAKLTYTASRKIEVAVMVLNGWQRIQMLKGNSLPALGTQFTYKANDRVLINWSSFLGTDDPDSTRRIRFFNNLYAKAELSKWFTLIGGFDIGMQQREKSGNVYQVWLSPVLIGGFSLSKSWKAALRAEYYQDRHGVMIATGTPHGFGTVGLSCNVDFIPVSNLIVRVEGRWLRSRDAIFSSPDQLRNSNFFVGTSIAYKIAKGF